MQGIYNIGFGEKSERLKNSDQYHCQLKYNVDEADQLIVYYRFIFKILIVKKCYKFSFSPKNMSMLSINI